MRPLSLSSKILLSTTAAITVLFAVTGWLVQRHTTEVTTGMLEDEVAASFRTYESLWQSRAANLASVSRIIASMSDVRAAFSTGDRATIADTAGDLWARISDADAFFLVADPRGRVIASLGGEPSQKLEGDLAFVEAVRSRFPEQATGFVLRAGALYQVSITPVYVQTGSTQGLLNVLVAGYLVDSQVAQHLKQATGSDFSFVKDGQTLASSLPSTATLGDYQSRRTELLDLQGKAVAELHILRSLSDARSRITGLRRNILLIYVIALLAGLSVTWMLARRLVVPIRELDRAAAEVAQENYDYRVPVRSEDELGRLAATFNTMCASIRGARDELIRRERISTIGQLATSIVHDLRNPLAAIYGGAEMLVDSKLPESQVKRLAGNIYRASRNIQDMLQELTDLSRGRADRAEHCRLRDVVTAAYEPLRATSEANRVSVQIDVPEELEAPLARNRMERVFANLLSNAIEAMKSGGDIVVSAKRQDNGILVDVVDSGPGIPPSIRSHVFQPFVSEGKKNGLGLGLALSRQTVLNHGGDLWVVDDKHAGAHFRLRLPQL